MAETPSQHTDPPATIPLALRRAATDFGALDALVGDGIRQTYTELDREVDQLSAALLASGVEAGDRIAIWAPNRAVFVSASFAVYRVGAILVPISSRYRGDEAASIIRRSGASMLFTVTDFLEPDPVSMLAGAGPLPTLRETIVMSGPAPDGTTSLVELIARADAPGVLDGVAAREALVGANDISDIIFTSGTTGQPKGAMLRHGASVRTYLGWSERVGLRAGDRYLVVFPFFHTSGLKSGILACVLRGASIHPQAVFDVPAIMRRVVDEQITMLPGPPTVFQTILAHPDLATFDLSSVRSAVTGAAVVPEEIIRRMRSELHIPDIVTGYGLTETTGTISVCRYDDPPEVVAGTSGRPLDGVEVRIVDDAGADVAVGAVGEVLARGFNIMAGYYDDADGTDAAIDSDGWLATGDIGYVDAEGRIHITDRKKEMFIVGGFNAYPAEIESRLLEHPDIIQAAVVGVPDERMGEVGLAFLVLRADATVRPDDIGPEITAWARERMANFKVPRTFRVVDSLPLNATGKIAKAELRATMLAEQTKVGGK
ncbi:MAG: acyl-CoA synthetase (AMP-forming)/AMP-acid ligase [Ilumatobacteraceae bacterium]|nr:acyl-CoA synthetase (AMP-forming)/AMP-acid ligase [Ilumatobacteraceae bacterium]